jgi:hypothetical protein
MGRVEQAAAAAAAAEEQKREKKRAAPVAVDPLSGEAIFDQDGRDAGKAVLGACVCQKRREPGSRPRLSQRPNICDGTLSLSLY